MRGRRQISYDCRNGGVHLSCHKMMKFCQRGAVLPVQFGVGGCHCKNTGLRSLISGELSFREEIRCDKPKRTD